MFVSKKEIIAYLVETMNEVLHLELDIKIIKIDQPLSQIGIDSIDVVSIIIKLEDFYEIEFIDEGTYSEDLGSIESISTIIFKKLLKKDN